MGLPGAARLRQILKQEGPGGVWRRLRSRVLRLLRPRRVRSAYGIDLTARWDDATFLFYLQGSYGFVFSDFLKQRQRDFVFLDIGANQGLYSILAAGNPVCRGAIAFEPVPETAEVLEANLALNRSRGVAIVRKAISDRAGRVALSVEPGHSGTASLRSGAEGGRIEIETIDAAGLEQIVPAGAPEIVVKIDVEGHEAVVLAELMKCSFQPRIAAIFYEVDQRWVDPETLRKLLQENGFSEFRKVGNGSHYDVLAERPQGRP